VTPPNALSDRVLCERAIAGDNQAFAAIIGRYKGQIFGLVRRYVGGDEDTNDLLQQIFLTAWQSLGRYDQERPLGPWLITIALNKCRDYSRKAKVRRFFQIAWPSDANNVPDKMPGADQTMSADQELHLVEKAIAQLPIALKEPLLLTVFQGLSHEQAGAQLGLSAKAIEGRTRRARQALERQINAWINIE
jgi:RNA polymerase sigma factor (sigma-70 family)